MSSVSFYSYPFELKLISDIITFRAFHSNGNGNAFTHTTNSFTIADAITRLRDIGTIWMSSHDFALWNTIFEHTFGRSVEEELHQDGLRQTVWNVDGRWTGWESDDEFEGQNERFTLVVREEWG